MDKSLRDSFRQFSRNEKWGSCGSCPRDSEFNAYPEFCQYYDRYDHQLTIDELQRAYKSSIEYKEIMK